jgi:hypothetical protein
VDAALRKRAKLTGRSLNRIVVEDLAAQSGVPLQQTPNQTLADELSWFIGSGIDDETLQILEQEDKEQKKLMAKEWKLDT